MRPQLFLAAPALLLAACGSRQSDPAPAPTAVVLPPADYTPCAACHAGVADINAVGPSLWQVVGRRAGTVPGYDYSPAFRQLSVVWDDASLDRWLTNPAAMAPGTKMTFAGYADPAQRRAVIAYLKTLK